MTTTCIMILGDCLEVMPKIETNLVRLMISDLPYGVSGCEWDKPLSWSKFACQCKVILKNKLPLIYFCSDKGLLHIVSQREIKFKYLLVWDKGPAFSFMTARFRPMIGHEFIAICGKTPTYNPQFTYGHRPVNSSTVKIASTFYEGFRPKEPKRKMYDDRRHPKSILPFLRDKRVRRVRKRRNEASHPTQKPVALIDWLIRSYSNAGDTVLDPTSGSGTTAVSACQNGRSVVCIEKDEGYFEASVERVRKHIRDNLLDVKLEVRK